MEYERNMNNKPAVLETLFCALATLLNLSVRRDIQVGALVCCAAIQLKLHVSRDIQLDAVLSVGQGGCKLNMLMSAKRHLAAASSRVCLAPRSRCRSTPTCHSSRQAGFGHADDDALPPAAVAAGPRNAQMAATAENVAERYVGKAALPTTDAPLLLLQVRLIPTGGPGINHFPSLIMHVACHCCRSSC